jgi:hypothetical protein
MQQRQEVVNVVLAQLLAEHGLVAAPEQIIKSPSTATRMPDVILDFHGLRLAVEAEFIDAPNAASAAFTKAQSRVEQELAHYMTFCACITSRNWSWRGVKTLCTS